MRESNKSMKDFCAECGKAFYREAYDNQSIYKKMYFCSDRCKQAFRRETNLRGIPRNEAVFSEYYAMRHKSRQALKSLQRMKQLNLKTDMLFPEEVSIDDFIGEDTLLGVEKDDRW